MKAIKQEEEKEEEPRTNQEVKNFNK